MSFDDALFRKQLVTAISGRESHIDFASAVKDFPANLRGVKPEGAPHSAWQLLGHLRIAQHDILEFSRNPKHKSPNWPEGYWPETDAPQHPGDWDASVEAFQRDARELEKMIENPEKDLFRTFAHGDGENLLREALLVATHNSYHLGQLMLLKKMLSQKS